MEHDPAHLSMNIIQLVILAGYTCLRILRGELIKKRPRIAWGGRATGAYNPGWGDRVFPLLGER